MSTSHTPGPWIAKGATIWADRPGRDSAGIPVVASCLVAGHDDPRNEANARLIAAAPELLAELRKLEWSRLRQGEQYCPRCGRSAENPHTPACSLGAAIAKATGAA